MSGIKGKNGTKGNTGTPPAPSFDRAQDRLVRGERIASASDSPQAAGKSERVEIISPLTRGAGGVSKARKYLPYDKSLTALARENRKNPSPAESLLWSALLGRRHFVECKFHRQKPIGRYVVDFYCAELALVIEVDGDSHASQVDYDAQRSRFLEGLGLTVLRYANQEVLGNLEGVCEDLWGWVVGKTATPPAPLVRGERISPSPDAPQSEEASERAEINSPLTRGAGGVSGARKKDTPEQDESPTP